MTAAFNNYNFKTTGLAIVSKHIMIHDCKCNNNILCCCNNTMYYEYYNFDTLLYTYVQ